MLLIAFKPLDYRKQSTFPPLIIRLNHQLLNKTIIQIKTIVHCHFKQYLSPFINQHNLNLSNKQSQCMINSLPLYMYIDNKQYTQYVLCTTRPNTINQLQQKYKFISNSLVYIVHNDNNNNQSSSQQLYSIPQKQIQQFDNRLSHIALLISQNKNIQMVVNGNVIKLNNQNGVKKWSQIIDQNWKQLVHHNDCVYVKISIN